MVPPVDHYTVLVLTTLTKVFLLLVYPEDIPGKKLTERSDFRGCGQVDKWADDGVFSRLVIVPIGP